MTFANPGDSLQTLLYKLSLEGSVLPPPFTFDQDAEAYFLAAGVTDAAAQIQINNWIVGLKALNLWTSITEMYTLRSTQNAGTGTTLYGMKRVANGSLVNGPTWGTDGITFNGGTTSISITGLGSTFNNKGAGWIVAVCEDTQLGTGTMNHPAVFFSTNAGTSSRLALNTRLSSLSNFSSTSRRLDGDTPAQSTAASSAGYHFLEGRGNWTGNSDQLVVDGVPQTAATYSSGAGVTSSTDSASVQIGAIPVSALFFPGVISFVLAGAFLPTLSQAESVRSLYKSTLGEGLTLP